MEIRDCHEPFRDIAEDHRGLLARLALLEALDDPESIRAALASLVPLLELHFEREEAPDGMFVRVVAQDPRQSGEIESLRDEHVASIERALDLVERAGETIRSGGTSAELCREVREFVTGLRRHEAREDALLTDAHYHEEGGGD